MNALLVGLGCFTLHAAASLIWLRLPGRISPVARHAVSAFGTHALGVALAAGLIGPLAYWPVAAVNGFLVVGWLFAFSVVYKSVSLRILTQLDRAPGHTLALESIVQEFVRPEFAARIAVLVKMGCAEETDDGFATTGKGNATAYRIALIQRACGIHGSGMYGEASRERKRPEFFLASRERKRPEESTPVAYAPGSPRTIPPIP